MPVLLYPLAHEGEQHEPVRHRGRSFDDHIKANAAVHKLIDGGFNMKNFSVVGKGYHTEEKIIGLYNVGDRMKLWGKYGAFWGASGA
jgi:hypothetical protein